MWNGKTILIPGFSLLVFVFLIFPMTAICRIRTGVASVDITPKEPIRLAGYAARIESSRGAIHPIFAKSIAFEDSAGTLAVLLTADIIGFTGDLSEEIATRVEKQFGIPRSNLMITASHTHTAPLLEKAYSTMSDLSLDQAKTISRYTRFLKEALVRIVDQSLQNLAPARLAFGTGEAHIAVNRRSFTPKGVVIGIDPDGPVDPRVLTMSASDSIGNFKAVLFGYACHGTSLAKDDYTRVCGDYMGFARECLETSQPGIMGLYVAGCGADLNPYPRGKLNDARLHGLRLAGAVAEALKPGMIPVRDPIRCAFKTVQLPFASVPSAADFQKRLENENPSVRRHARYFLDKLEKGEKIPATYAYPIQVWRFGDDLTLVALGGEVVVDYARRLRRELNIVNLWTIAYANDVCGYIGTARTLYEGGYEADQSAIYYALPSRWDFSIEEKIISTVKEMVAERGNP